MNDDEIISAVKMVYAKAILYAFQTGTMRHLYDYNSAGLMAIVSCMKTYDASHGATFRTYAYHRAAGAMKDFLRRLCRRSKPKYGNVHLCHTYSINEWKSLEPSYTPDIRGEIDRKDFLRQLRRDVRAAIDATNLSERDKEMVRLRYCKDYTVEDIAPIYGVNPSRVSQIMTKAKVQLRQSLRQYDGYAA